jgi:hypothetical protein
MSSSISTLGQLLRAKLDAAAADGSCYCDHCGCTLPDGSNTDRDCGCRYHVTQLFVYQAIVHWDGVIDESCADHSPMFSTWSKAKAWADNYKFDSYQRRCGGCGYYINAEEVL